MKSMPQVESLCPVNYARMYSRLRSTWGERLFRILLRAGNPGTHAVWTTRITQ